MHQSVNRQTCVLPGRLGAASDAPTGAAVLLHARVVGGVQAGERVHPPAVLGCASVGWDSPPDWARGFPHP
eukprot:2423307-Alexandrium_andersonii.AAC.1